MPDQGNTRIAHCDICGNDIASLFSSDTGFVYGRVASLHPNEENVGCIGTCASCDIDVCHRCSVWSHPSADELPGDLKDTQHLWYCATCPKCGKGLTGKTPADWNRLKAWFESLRSDRCRAVSSASRMLRICREEDPIFCKMYEGTRFLELTRLLETIGGGE